MMLSTEQLKIYKYITIFIIGLILLMAIIGHPQMWQVFKLYSPYSNGVNFHGFSLSIFLFIILNYALTAFLGYGITYRFFANVNVQFLIKLFAGFLFGYVAICGLERISTLLFSGFISYFLVSIFAIIIGYYFIKTFPKNLLYTLNSKKFTKKNVLIFLIAALIFLAAVLMLQITQAEFSWVGHGPKQYTHFLLDWMKAGYIHMPIARQHYDEFSYHYWASFLYLKKLNPIIPWWITLALVKLSIYCFLYATFRKLHVSYWFAFIFASFFMFGTSSPLFNKYYLLFDASNPLFFTVHSGRVVGVAIAIFLIIHILNNKNILPSSPELALIIGLGLATTSLSNNLWAIAVILAIMLLKSHELKSAYASQIFWFIPITIILLLFMYPWHLGSFSKLQALCISQIVIYFKMLICIVYLLLCLYVFFNFYKNTKKTSLPRKEFYIYFIFILSIVFGISILGNILSSWIYGNQSVIQFLSLYHIKVETLAEWMYENTWQWQTLIGDHRELLDLYNGYCYSVFYFAAYYGLLLIAMLLTNIVYISQETTSIQDKKFFYLYVTLAASLPFLFFFMDYVDLGARAWVKSRFLEIPVYSLLFISLYFMYKFFSRKQNIILMIFCWFYSVVPFILTDRFKQLWANTHLFIQIINHAKGYRVLM